MRSHALLLSRAAYPSCYCSIVHPTGRRHGRKTVSVRVLLVRAAFLDFSDHQPTQDIIDAVLPPDKTVLPRLSLLLALPTHCLHTLLSYHIPLPRRSSTASRVLPTYHQTVKNSTALCSVMHKQPRPPSAPSHSKPASLVYHGMQIAINPFRPSDASTSTAYAPRYRTNFPRPKCCDKHLAQSSSYNPTPPLPCRTASHDVPHYLYLSNKYSIHDFLQAAKHRNPAPPANTRYSDARPVSTSPRKWV
jgi:hypothetical protein